MTYNHYKSELKKVAKPDEFGASIQIRANSVYTDWLNINSESIPEIIAYLEELQKKQDDKPNPVAEQVDKWLTQFKDGNAHTEVIVNFPLGRGTYEALNRMQKTELFDVEWPDPNVQDADAPVVIRKIALKYRVVYYPSMKRIVLPNIYHNYSEASKVAEALCRSWLPHVEPV